MILTCALSIVLYFLYIYLPHVFFLDTSAWRFCHVSLVLLFLDVCVTCAFFSRCNGMCQLWRQRCLPEVCLASCSGWMILLDMCLCTLTLYLFLSVSHSYALPPWFDFHLFGVYATLIPVRLT